MRHHCTACLYDFFDETGGLPHSDVVHCVRCGSRIPLRRKTPERLPAAVPFGQDVEREETFALGVIHSERSGFRDTLRQFRVRPPVARPDSLAPVSQSHDAASVHPRAAWRSNSFWVSLGVGLGAGVAIASSLTSPASETPSAAQTGASEPAAAAPAVPSAPNSVPAPAPVQPKPAFTATPPVTCATAASAPTTSVPARPPSKVLERRWVLERARSQQRQYRLDDAERLYRQVLASAPRDSEALAGLGEVELLRGTADRADEHFRRALAVNADYIPALVAIADIRWQTGRLDEARSVYRGIVESYSAELYPPYVAQRSEPSASGPCEEAVELPSTP